MAQSSSTAAGLVRQRWAPHLGISIYLASVWQKNLKKSCQMMVKKSLSGVGKILPVSEILGQGSSTFGSENKDTDVTRSFQAWVRQPHPALAP